MVKKDDTASNASESATDLRGTLFKRLGVAGALVGLLLGVLAFFDYLVSSDEQPEAPIYTAPIPVPPKRDVTQPVKPVESLPEPPKSETSPPEAPSVAVPAKPEASPTSTPSATKIAPKVPTVASPVHPEVKMPPKPEAPRLPSPSVAASSPRSVPATQEATAAPVVHMQPEVRPAAPVRIVEAPMPQPPASPRLFSAYVLKAGVFTDVRRAEELHARLTLNGIPSTLEARVQVGPFKSRDEAVAAQEKLQKLGVDALLLMPPGAKPH